MCKRDYTHPGRKSLGTLENAGKLPIRGIIAHDDASTY